MQASSAVFGILVSQEVARSDGAAVLELCAQSGFTAELVLHDRNQPPSVQALQRLRLALLSVDVLGSSTKSLHEPELQTFIDTLRAAPQPNW